MRAEFDECPLNIRYSTNLCGHGLLERSYLRVVARQLEVAEQVRPLKARRTSKLVRRVDKAQRNRKCNAKVFLDRCGKREFSACSNKLARARTCGRTSPVGWRQREEFVRKGHLACVLFAKKQRAKQELMTACTGFFN